MHKDGKHHIKLISEFSRPWLQMISKPDLCFPVGVDAQPKILLSYAILLDYTLRTRLLVLIYGCLVAATSQQ